MPTSIKCSRCGRTQVIERPIREHMFLTDDGPTFLCAYDKSGHGCAFLSGCYLCGRDTLVPVDAERCIDLCWRCYEAAGDPLRLDDVSVVVARVLEKAFGSSTKSELLTMEMLSTITDVRCTELFKEMDTESSHAFQEEYQKRIMAATAAPDDEEAP